MFGLPRRLFSTTARVASEIAQNPTHVTPDALPPVLQRLIMRALQGREGEASVEVPNPFLPSKPNGAWVPAYLSRRRQKQLLQMYPAHVLPPSPINPVPAVPVNWGGIEVKWAGEVKPKEAKSIYANRNTLFKGHKRERERPVRQKEIKDRMDGMEKRIAEWKAIQAEEKATAKPSLPF